MTSPLSNKGNLDPDTRLGMEDAGIRQAGRTKDWSGFCLSFYSRSVNMAQMACRKTLAAPGERLMLCTSSILIFIPVFTSLVSIFLWHLSSCTS